MPASKPAASAPASRPAIDAAAKERLDLIASILKKGTLVNDEVYVITYPREDLNVYNDLGDIPVGAGLESQFRFFNCEGKCRRMSVIGQFCCVEYESNDVIDELRSAALKVVSVGPMLSGERPRLVLVRFQGDGSAQQLANAIKKALRWMGEERTKPAP